MGKIEPPPVTMATKTPLKLPSVFTREKKPDVSLYLSLLLDSLQVTASVWKTGNSKDPILLASGSASVPADAWSSRIDASDVLLSHLEEKTNTTSVDRVVLGLPAIYLTSEGDIIKEIRPEIKRLTNELELKPIGFVPITQALMYNMKKIEGIPPSVLLVGFSSKQCVISLYKVGQLVAQTLNEYDGNAVEAIESFLKSHADIEVYPSRIRLYGGTTEQVTEAKNALLRYPWTQKGNFLHFPKIDILLPEDIIIAVTVAGASELTTEVVEDVVQVETDESKNSQTEDVLHAHANGNVMQAGDVDKKHESLSEDIVSAEANRTLPQVSVDYHEDNTKKTKVDELEEVKRSDSEYTENITDTRNDETLEDRVHAEQENVVLIDPEKVGFITKSSISSGDDKETISDMEENQDINYGEQEENEDSFLEQKNYKKHVKQFSLPKIAVSSKVIILFFVLFIILGLGVWLGVYVLPKAEVVIVRDEKNVTFGSTVLLDPNRSTVDTASLAIPALFLEATTSAQKTIAVTGKKKVGDPAKGTITIFNKSLSPKTFKKGTQLSAGSIMFALSSDVTIASASENLVSGTITFGKGTVDANAVTIGTQGNIAANTDLTFKDVASSIAIARNETAFSGGTSRDVSVVSRGDYDAIVKAASEEVISQAQKILEEKLQGSVLIEGTVKTAVVGKKFDHELDEEANQVTGDINITITGMTYRPSDMSTLIESVMISDLPGGYTFVTDKTIATTDKPVVKKDGSVAVSVNGTALGIPSIDGTQIQKKLIGKTKTEAETLIRNIEGVKDAVISIKSIMPSRLPFSLDGITVRVEGSN